MTTASDATARMIGVSDESTANETDGRRMRRQRNRESALDALIALFMEGDYQPSAAQVAERAGLSPRSLFRYFDDVDDLVRAAIDRMLRAAAPLVGVTVANDAPIHDRVRALVAARVRLFSAVAPAARAARVCAHRHAPVAEQVSRARVFLARQIADILDPEARLPGGTERLRAVDALCSFETFDFLHAQGLSDEEISTTLTSAVEAVITHEGIQQ